MLLLLPSISAGTDRPTGHRFNLSALFFHYCLVAELLSLLLCCCAKGFSIFPFLWQIFSAFVCAVWLLCAEIVHFFVALTLLLLVLTFVLSLLKLAQLQTNSQSSESNAHTRGQLLQLNCLIRATAAALISNCSCCFCCCRRCWPLAVILWHHHHHRHC